MTREEAEKKVFDLTEKLIFTKKDLKDVTAGYKDTIKEIQGEIEAIVEEFEIKPLAAAARKAEDESKEE